MYSGRPGHCRCEEGEGDTPCTLGDSGTPALLGWVPGDAPRTVWPQTDTASRGETPEDSKSTRARNKTAGSGEWNSQKLRVGKRRSAPSADSLSVGKERARRLRGDKRLTE